MTCVWCGCGDWRVEHASFCPTVDPSWLAFLDPLRIGDTPVFCTPENCGRPVVAKGWCKTHYMRQYRIARAEASAA